MAKDSPSTESSDSSVIGRTIHVRGNIEGHEDMIFRGSLEGELNLNGRHLTISEGARVNATVRAQVVSVSGAVTGKIEPSELLEVRATGQVSGEVLTPRLSCEGGASLDGRFSVGPTEEGGGGAIADFGNLRLWLDQELKDLTEVQLDYSAESPNWTRWSIRRQVSHMANSVILWLVGRWSDILWKDRTPDPEFVEISKAEHGHDRMLDPEKYRDIKSLGQILQRAYDLIRQVAGRESMESLREKTLVLKLPADAKLGTSNESVHELWARYSAAHKGDIVRDPSNAYTWSFTLEAMLRHLYFEHLAHIRTIQRLKEKQALKAVVELPREGYLKFDDHWAS
ncbi:MAG: polymer-forming cytoskeletal protein [Nitrospinota bacterium]|jgi:cytoskeletal protein CcmA (bactofilin family)|nr:polymer-forming cytoskeletal protein [Nitrospinota bacterium]